MTTSKDTILGEVIEGDLQTLFNLLESVSDDSRELKEVYQKFKYGINIIYHIEWNLKGLHEIRERQGTVLLKGKTYPIEEWWDEEEARRKIARKTLMEYYEDDSPYEARK